MLAGLTPAALAAQEDGAATAGSDVEEVRRAVQDDDPAAHADLLAEALARFGCSVDAADHPRFVEFTNGFVAETYGAPLPDPYPGIDDETYGPLVMTIERMMDDASVRLLDDGRVSFEAGQVVLADCPDDAMPDDAMPDDDMMADDDMNEEGGDGGDD